MLGVSWVLAGSWQSPNLIGDLLALQCGLTLAAKFMNDRAVSQRNMTPVLISASIMIAAISVLGGEVIELERWHKLHLMTHVLVYSKIGSLK